MSINKKGFRLENYAPPGIELTKELVGFGVVMTGAFIYSLSFVGRYLTNRSALYETVNKKRILIEGARMLPFDVLIEGSMMGFFLVMIIMVGVIGFHYLYHHMESKSIYLMKRLPNKLERHLRSFALPFIGMAVSASTMILLYFVYFGIYMLCTPEQCLPL